MCPGCAGAVHRIFWIRQRVHFRVFWPNSIVSLARCLVSSSDKFSIWLTIMTAIFFFSHVALSTCSNEYAPKLARMRSEYASKWHNDDADAVLMGPIEENIEWVSEGSGTRREWIRTYFPIIDTSSLAVRLFNNEWIHLANKTFAVFSSLLFDIDGCFDSHNSCCTQTVLPLYWIRTRNRNGGVLMIWYRKL